MKVLDQAQKIKVACNNSMLVSGSIMLYDDIMYTAAQNPIHSLSFFLYYYQKHTHDG